MNDVKRLLIGTAIVLPAFFGFAGTAAADTDVLVADTEFAATYAEAFGASYSPAGFAIGHTVDETVEASDQTVAISTR